MKTKLTTKQKFKRLQESNDNLRVSNAHAIYLAHKNDDALEANKWLRKAYYNANEEIRHYEAKVSNLEFANEYHKLTLGAAL